MNINIIKSNVKKNKNRIIGEDSEYSKYAVVIPLIWVENSLSILFEVRSKKMKSQPGEISFPGGRLVRVKITLKLL
jgi:hypothetical protein